MGTPYPKQMDDSSLIKFGNLNLLFKSNLDKHQYLKIIKKKPSSR
jgi:hypothetical protein